MKYLRQYCNKVLEGVKGYSSANEYSNSYYYELKPSYIIRLSDHLSPIDRSDKTLNIVKLFKSDNFIVTYRKSRIPVVKTREEVRQIIKQIYELVSVEIEMERNNGIALTETIKKYPPFKLSKNSLKIYEMCPKVFDTEDASTFFSGIGSLTPIYKLYPSEKRTILKTLFGEGLRGAWMIQFLLDNIDTDVKELRCQGNARVVELKLMREREKLAEIEEKREASKKELETFLNELK